jgi:2-oxo-4-hydroxy-4-carboxy-5-ureidoimidazoline decarboxylase
VIARFNETADTEAVRELYSCFASQSWAERVAAGRPYADFEGLWSACEAAWSGLAEGDWLAAFAAHPRIGESGGHAPESSEREQSGVHAARHGTLDALAEENRRYEARFGHVFLISVSGRTADEILTALRQRMSNDPATEIEVAAAEHRKITRLRLERVLAE